MNIRKALTDIIADDTEVVPPALSATGVGGSEGSGSVPTGLPHIRQRSHVAARIASFAHASCTHPDTIQKLTSVARDL